MMCAVAPMLSCKLRPRAPALACHRVRAICGFANSKGRVLCEPKILRGGERRKGRPPHFFQKQNKQFWFGSFCEHARRRFIPIRHGRPRGGHPSGACPRVERRGDSRTLARWMAGSSPAMTKGEPEKDAPPDFWRFEWELSELRQGVPSPSISGGSNGNFAAPPGGCAIP
jgi:hypothetical protein